MGRGKKDGRKEKIKEWKGKREIELFQMRRGSRMSREEWEEKVTE